MILKGQVSAMITENQVKNYLRSKDKDYVDKLIESLYEQDNEDIDQLILPFILFQRCQNTQG